MKIQLSWRFIMLFAMFSTSTYASQIVISGTELDLSSTISFDTGILTLTGPKGFNRQIKISPNQTVLDAETLGIEDDGSYNYRLEYIQQGKTVLISDPKKGRINATKNLGKVITKTGHFNVKSNEFLMQADEESEARPQLKNESHITVTERNNGRQQ